ncbi:MULTISPECIES: hypothetical protein [unclassified Streptomyces]|uniref:hypothetical protein n=1 Tax=unclassified Streptomyces TaxID=2593676 RepID=UPI003826D791
MSDFIVRLFEPLLRGLFPSEERGHPRPTPPHPVPAVPRRPVGFRSVVVFVHGCRTAVGGTHGTLLLFYARSEFERSERVVQWRRRQRRRELWIAGAAR